VSKRQLEWGYNELPEKKRHPLLVFLSYFWGPMPIMICEQQHRFSHTNNQRPSALPLARRRSRAAPSARIAKAGRISRRLAAVLPASCAR